MERPAGSLLLSFACAAMLAFASAVGEAAQENSALGESFIVDESVQLEDLPPIKIKVDNSLLHYYSRLYWHDNRFGAVYMLSKDKAEAQAALGFHQRFLEDAVRLSSDRFYYDLTLCQVYARLAWMAKDSGDEAEYQRLVEQAVFRLRRWKLLRDEAENDPDHWQAQLQAAKTAPLTNAELYDALYMVLAIDRHGKVAWVEQSDYDFDGFINQLNKEEP